MPVRWREEGLTGDRLGSSRIPFAHELAIEERVLVVIPVAQNDGVFIIILVHLGSIVDNERGTKTVNVLALENRLYVDPDPRVPLTLEWACTQ